MKGKLIILDATHYPNTVEYLESSAKNDAILNEIESKKEASIKRMEWVNFSISSNSSWCMLLTCILHVTRLTDIKCNNFSSEFSEPFVLSMHDIFALKLPVGADENQIKANKKAFTEAKRKFYVSLRSVKDKWVAGSALANFFKSILMWNKWYRLSVFIAYNCMMKRKPT